jgi:hypothetical protein
MQLYTTWIIFEIIFLIMSNGNAIVHDMDHLCDMQIGAVTNEGSGSMRFKHWGPMFSINLNPSVCSDFLN